MTPAEPLFWGLIATTFFASCISSTFAMGGGFVVLALLASVLPLTAVVPIHSALMLGMSLGRAWFFRIHVNRRIAVPFVAGCLIGAPLGAGIYLRLPEALIAAVLCVFILSAVWAPPVKWRPRIPHAFFYVGVIHAFLSSMFSFGGLLQPLVMRSSLDRMQVIGTLAVSLVMMNVTKIGGYLVFGFDFRPYLLVIGAAVLAGIPGAWLGRRLAMRVPERRFRMVFRLMMSLVAVRLAYRAWALI